MYFAFVSFVVGLVVTSVAAVGLTGTLAYMLWVGVKTTWLSQ